MRRDASRESIVPFGACGQGHAESDRVTSLSPVFLPAIYVANNRRMSIVSWPISPSVPLTVDGYRIRKAPLRPR